MRLLFQMLSVLPLWALHGLGAFAGWLRWVIPNSRRDTALRNIERCFPEMPRAEQRRMAARSLRHELKTILELPLLWLGAPSRVMALIRRSEGEELVEEALAQGRGLILLTLHQGSFEAPAIPFSARHVITGLYKPQKGAIDGLSRQGRSRFGGRLISTSSGGVRQQLLPLLRNNESVYFLPDQDPPAGRGIFAPFFGLTAHSPVLVAKMIRESGSPVLFFFGERLPFGRGYNVHFRAAPPGIYSEDLLTSVTAMNAGLEACIREFPEQYWWGYKRFRRQPEGAPDFYAAT